MEHENPERLLSDSHLLTTSNTSSIATHLRTRYLEPERYTTVYVSEEHRTASFLIWNLSRQLIGYQRYSPDFDKEKRNDEKYGRYYTYISPELPKTMAGVWGLETYNYRSDVLCIVEGVFDAVRLHNRGIPAVATFTSNPKPIRNWLSLVPRRLVAIRDNDENDASKLQYFADVCYQTESKDLGDASEDEVDTIVKRILGNEDRLQEVPEDGR